MNVSDYKVKLGVMSFGGCGNTVALQIMNQIDPKDYPDLHIFAGNTDAKVLKRYYGDKEAPNIKRYIDVGAFCEEQFGRDSVTAGNGAGGDPKIGRKAAETPESIEAMRAWLETVDEVILVGGLGGGTATGAMPVAAKLCEEMGKSALALVVMPEPEEGLQKYAVPALKEIQSIVTTATIYNSRLMAHLETLPEEKRNSLTTREARAIINDKSLVRILKILREVIQETGEEEFDLADYRMTKSRGKHFYFDIADVEPGQLKSVTAKSVVDDLLKGEFIDKGVAERGELISLWFHGAWPHLLKQGVRNDLRGRLLAKRKERTSDPEIHWGLFEETKDRALWVAVMIPAKDEPMTAHMDQVEVLEQAWQESGSEPKPAHEKSEPTGHLEISFTSAEGKKVQARVPTELALRFNRIDFHTPTEKVKAIYAEVKEKTGSQPDLSDWHREPTGHSANPH